MIFSPGDTVQLRSGGPTMTVRSVEDKKGEQYCECFWFDASDHFQRMSHHSVVLMLVERTAIPVNDRTYTRWEPTKINVKNEFVYEGPEVQALLSDSPASSG